MNRSLPGRLATANVAAKVALLVLLAHGAAFPDLPQYVDKGMGYRLALYPLSALVVPAVWALTGRRRPYPHVIDLLLVAPFLIDTAGNAAGLYDDVSWWDDVMHVVTWIPLVCAFGLAVRALVPRRLELGALTLGFGAVTHILWELGEYVTFVADSPTESATAYRDTMGDLTASLSGSALGAVLVATVLFGTGRAVADPLVAPPAPA